MRDTVAGWDQRRWDFLNTGMLGWANVNCRPKLLRPDMRQDIQTDKDGPAPEQKDKQRIKKPESFICVRRAFASV